MMQPAEMLSFLEEQTLMPGEPVKAPARAVLGTESSGGAAAVRAGAEQSFFSESSIISFAAEVGPAVRQDVLNSMLFAQMAANSVPDEGEGLLTWYKRFLEVLGMTGWLIEGKDVQTYKADGSVFEVEGVLIDILKTAFGSNYIGIIINTLTAIKELSGQSKKLKAFERNVERNSKGCFQIALATERDGLVSLQLGTFVVITTETVQSILFFKSQSSKTELKYISKKASLNPEVSGFMREKIAGMLKDKLLTNIAEIELS
jgi:hypothetical protein